MSSTPAAQRWARLVAEYAASGQSSRDFAQSRGLNPRTFAWWRSRLARGRPWTPPAPRFVELAVVPSAPPKPADGSTLSGLTVRLSALGVAIEVDAEADLGLLRRVVEALC